MHILETGKRCLLARNNYAKIYLLRYSSKEPSKKYSDTLCLPKTGFSLTRKRDSEIQKVLETKMELVCGRFFMISIVNVWVDDLFMCGINVILTER